MKSVYAKKLSWITCQPDPGDNKRCWMLGGIMSTNKPNTSTISNRYDT